jgi:hypothetical protein
MYFSSRHLLSSKTDLMTRLCGIQAMPLAFATQAIQDDLVSEG